MLDAALAYAARGWAVFPCQPLKKLPATPHGFKDASTDAERIREWWTEHPDYNIGIVTGSLLVLDADRHEADGVESLRLLCTEHEPLPDTLTVETPNNGLHYYLSCQQPLRGRVGLRPGLDVKGEGGYVLAPPSVLPTGAYTQRNGAAVSEAPPWLVELLASRSKSPTPSVELPEAWEAGVSEGQRNVVAAQLAGKYLGLGLGASEALALLHSWNERNDPPLDRPELEAVVRSIARRELGLDVETETRADTLAMLSSRFRLRIDDIRRIGGDDPIYEFCAEGKTVTMPVPVLTSQTRWRNAMAALCQVLPKAIGPKATPSWDWYVQTMMDVAEEIEVGHEATQEGTLEAWLSAYMEHRLDRLRSSEEEQERAGEPVLHHHRVAVHIPSWLQYLRLHRIDDGIRPREFAQIVKRHGFAREAIMLTVRGQRVCRSMWLVPERLLNTPPIERK